MPVKHIHIPQEIYVTILENLYDDVHTLKACILTCHAWVPLVRALLFQHITLQLATCYDRLNALIQAGYGPLIRHVAISPRVKTEAKRIRSSDRRRTHNIPPVRLDTSWLHKLDIVLPHLPNATLLRLEGICFTSSGDTPQLFANNLAPLTWTTARVFHDSFRSLRRLSLTKVWIEDVRRFAAYLAEFPGLATIQMDGALVVPDIGTRSNVLETLMVLPQTEHAAETVIRNLTFVDSDATLVAAQIALPTRLALTHLCWIDYPTLDSQKALGSILIQSSSTLVNLHLRLIGFPFSQYEYLPGTLDNVRLTAVTEVLLAIVCHDRPGPMSDWCPRLLTCIDSQDLRFVAFHFVLLETEGRFVPQHMPPLDWDAIDSELLRLQSLNSELMIAFCAHSMLPPSSDWISDLLRDVTCKLSQASGQGIPICFKFLDDSKRSDEIRIEDLHGCLTHWAPRHGS